ncbi:signal transduction histidine kinase [Archangium gephyra]|uniref:histidine kinase n=1 Tax=Archangium gephyra TaxID=48 RepID=A0AAC8TBG7_9BACT|nr:HAMP domain-containing sensor histidine kinase [Archangium gephyra]AKI99834.1 Sensory box histidine kinase [Archangium gephyra]REG33448.1 signal transduction histidine kinase [Archangium gephyra]
MAQVTLHTRLCRNLRRLAVIQGSVVLVVGLLVFIAWLADLESLKGLRPGLPTMKANTALGFILSGATLVLVGLPNEHALVRRGAQVGAGLVILLGGLTFAQYLFDVDLGLDQLLVEDPRRGVELGYPGRMAPNTAVCFLLLGGALFSLEVKTRLVGWPSQYLASLAAIITLVGFVGYLYGQQEFPGLSRYAQMALHTTVCFLLSASGVFLARPDRGFMGVVTHSGLGGVLSRWLLPPAFVLPILLGSLALLGFRAGAYALPFALALIAVGNVIAFAALVWGAAFALDRVEARRLRVEEERVRLEAREQAARAEAAAQHRERSRAEAAEREAQRAVRTREDVLAVVSHDLKNPLGSIALSTQLMRRLLPPGEEGERLRKHTHTIERSVERMDRLIKDLLDMASLQAGQLKLDLGRYAVDDLVRDGLVLLEPLAIEKRVELRTRLPLERCQVECDRDRFFQVLSNLVGNALKFTPEEGTVTVEVVPGEGFMRFSVRDTGPGIPAEALPHLFEPFWQVEGTGKKGTGLGLTISRGLVLAHGGSLEVESEQGQGSTFSFTLRRPPPRVERAPEPPVH